MSEASQEEYPPLLSPGFHYMTVSEMRKRYVEAFPLSSTRVAIMDSLIAITARLVNSWVVGELWVDGSFVTEKIDPEDADIVLRIGAGLYNDSLPEQREAIDWIISNLKTSHRCDSYILMEYPSSDPLYPIGELDRSYWHRQFGFSRELDYKGIAVIALPRGVI
jgi:hypothetical protein